MNKLVREHYPASKLPPDLREGLDPSGEVTVTIVQEEYAAERPLTLEEILALRRPPYRTAEEIDSAIRRDRDAWDD
jgi:hypothetical protein